MRTKLLLLIVLLGFNFFADAQELVSTKPEPRNAVLEEYTAVNCGACCWGHKEIDEMMEKYPGRIVPIGIHSGAMAIPYGDQPDFRTEWSQSWVNFFGIMGWPSGLVNRQQFPGEIDSEPYYPHNPPYMNMKWLGWEAAVKDILNDHKSAPVNIGAATVWNEDTRELSVTVELYYTGSGGGTNLLNIAVLENNISGYQKGIYGSDSYDHDHVMRDMLTGQWGTSVSGMMGTFFEKTYTYTVPAEWDINNLELAFYVTKSDKKTIHQGILMPAVPLGTNIVEEAVTTNLEWNVSPNPVNKLSELKFTLEADANVNISVYNLLGEKMSENKLGNLPGGMHIRSLNTVCNNLAQGAYLVELNIDGVRYSKRILVE